MLDKTRLPSAPEYYATQNILLKANGWQSARCPFHEDKHHSLSVHSEGAFKCHACGVKGGDVLAFHQLKYGLNFVEAAKSFGAWQPNARRARYVG